MIKPPRPEKPSQTVLYDALVLEAAQDMEFVDNLIAFTWNVPPQRYPSSDIQVQYAALLKILFKYTPIFGTFIFVPELTQQGNVHIHGMYTVQDRIKYYKQFLPICRQFAPQGVKIKEVFDREGWIDYLTKHIELNYHIFDDALPVPLTHCNVGVYKRMFAAIEKAKSIRLVMRSNAAAKLTRGTIVKAFKQVKPKKVKLCACCIEEMKLDEQEPQLVHVYLGEQEKERPDSNMTEEELKEHLTLKFD